MPDVRARKSWALPQAPQQASLRNARLHPFPAPVNRASDLTHGARPGACGHQVLWQRGESFDRNHWRRQRRAANDRVG